MPRTSSIRFGENEDVRHLQPESAKLCVLDYPGPAMLLGSSPVSELTATSIDLVLELKGSRTGSERRVGLFELPC
jgi:hypothetical protein